MSRPLRIEYPDAWYHVMNRGRRGESVFRKKEDYLAFIELLKDTVEMWNLRVGAYCLMPKHYHLLIQTPDANLSRCMRHVNGVYTQRFNRNHLLDGQLFGSVVNKRPGNAPLLTFRHQIHCNSMQGVPWSHSRHHEHSTCPH